MFPQPGAKRTTKKTLKEDKFQVFSFAQCLILKDIKKKSYISLKEFEIKAFCVCVCVCVCVCMWILSLEFMHLSLKQTLNTSDHRKKYKELEVSKTALLFFCE